MNTITATAARFRSEVDPLILILGIDPETGEEVEIDTVEVEDSTDRAVFTARATAAMTAAGYAGLIADLGL